MAPPAAVWTPRGQRRPLGAEKHRPPLTSESAFPHHLGSRMQTMSSTIPEQVRKFGRRNLSQDSLGLPHRPSHYLPPPQQQPECVYKRTQASPYLQPLATTTQANVQKWYGSRYMGMNCMLVVDPSHPWCPSSVHSTNLLVVVVVVVVVVVLDGASGGVGGGGNGGGGAGGWWWWWWWWCWMVLMVVLVVVVMVVVALVGGGGGGCGGGGGSGGGVIVRSTNQPPLPVTSLLVALTPLHWKHGPAPPHASSLCSCSPPIPRQCVLLRPAAHLVRVHDHHAQRHRAAVDWAGRPASACGCERGGGGRPTGHGCGYASCGAGVHGGSTHSPHTGPWGAARKGPQHHKLRICLTAPGGGMGGGVWWRCVVRVPLQVGIVGWACARRGCCPPSGDGCQSRPQTASALPPPIALQPLYNRPHRHCTRPPTASNRWCSRS